MYAHGGFGTVGGSNANDGEVSPEWTPGPASPGDGTEGPMRFDELLCGA
jgi:hypothetical protein